MASAVEPSPPPGRTLPRSVPLFVAVWVLGYALAVVVRTSHPLGWFVQDIVIPPLLIVACAVFGWAVLDWLKADWITPAERLILGAGLGLGLLGLLTFGLGLSGWTNMRAVPLGMLLVGSPRIARMLEAVGGCCRRARVALGPLEWALVGLAAAAGLLLVWAGRTPPTDYDVMEYHLALPKAYLAAGRIHETPENVYSYLPLGTEMLYQAAMSLRWAPEAPLASVTSGALVAKTLNAYLALLAAGAVASCAARGFGAKAAAPAAALFLTLPWIYLVSYRAMVENTQVLFTVMAFVALAAYLDTRRLGAAVLGGVMAGFALGAKYLVYGFLFVPGIIVIFGDGVTRRELRLAIRAALAYAVVATAVVSPWIIRNLVWTGNPLHPLLTSWFGPGPHWTAAQAAHFAWHHSPHSFAPAAIWKAMAPDSILAAAPVVLVLALGAVAVFLPPRRPAEMTQGFYALWIVAFWLAATHRVTRHLAPVWGPLAVLAAGGILAVKAGAGRRTLGAVAVLAVLCGMLFMMDHERSRARDYALLELPPGSHPGTKQPNYSPHVMHYLNLGRDLEGLGPDGPKAVGLVGEAQTLMLVRPVRYNTVWDTPWLAPAIEAWRETGSAAAVRAELARLGVATLYVNWLEIGRFRKPGNYGWPREISEELFEAWVAAGILQPLRTFGRKHADRNVWPHVLYRVVYAPAGASR